MAFIDFIRSFVATPTHRCTKNSVGRPRSFNNRTALQSRSVRMVRTVIIPLFRFIENNLFSRKQLMILIFSFPLSTKTHSVAEANPPATFKWFQRMKSGYLERGHESRLVIDNVTYDYQGEYECRATNYINGQERTVASEPVSLQVVGECLI